MTKVVLSPAERQDLFHIHRWLGRKNDLAARQTVLRIRDRIDLLRRHPLLGVARPDIGATARMLTEPPYIILYEVQSGTVAPDKEVIVIRIIDARRDLPELL
ncbi:type II toxin-antitoxin system RelE/ParE family toxin [Gellertiella hungarica]|uniref:Toxin ParE1/3/4 n=1 Tax=Gellertiella hungarica TaxID=1572859 RepID=A0A7W6J8W9_9HYPH|nr:toxin ParE1/3/4 [Gellertiella hungarica]